jgi:hypothetical protein
MRNSVVVTESNPALPTGWWTSNANTANEKGVYVVAMPWRK